MLGTVYKPKQQWNSGSTLSMYWGWGGVVEQKDLRSVPKRKHRQVSQINFWPLLFARTAHLCFLLVSMVRLETEHKIIS